MKRSGIRLLYLWLALFMLNTGCPAFCAVVASQIKCDPVEASTTECGACPLSAAKEESKPELPSCCELRVEEQTQNWLAAKSIELPAPAIAILPEPWIELPTPKRIAQPVCTETCAKPYERDVGVRRPRGPPSARV